MHSFVVVIKPHAVGNIEGIKALLLRDTLCSTVHHTQLTEEVAREFYAEHEGKWFFKRLIGSMTSGPCVVLLFIFPSIEQTQDQIAAMRAMAGATDPVEARKHYVEGDPDGPTVRALFGTKLPDNAVHVSDSVEAGDREAAILTKHIGVSLLKLTDMQRHMLAPVFGWDPDCIPSKF
jgi:nucleoside diphosphate kinase